jgi:hypothetical protein
VARQLRSQQISLEDFETAARPLRREARRISRAGQRVRAPVLVAYVDPHGSFSEYPAGVLQLDRHDFQPLSERLPSRPSPWRVQRWGPGARAAVQMAWGRVVERHPVVDQESVYQYLGRYSRLGRIQRTWKREVQRFTSIEGRYCSLMRREWVSEPRWDRSGRIEGWSVLERTVTQGGKPGAAGACKVERTDPEIIQRLDFRMEPLPDPHQG